MKKPSYSLITLWAILGFTAGLILALVYYQLFPLKNNPGEDTFYGLSQVLVFGAVGVVLALCLGIYKRRSK